MAKLDKKLDDDLKEFEEKEIIKIETEVSKILLGESKQEKDKKQTQIKLESQQLVKNLLKRFKNYQFILKEKQKKEFESIDLEIENSYKTIKNTLENIQIDTQNKEKIFQEIKKFDTIEDILKPKIEKIGRNIFTQKKENTLLSQKYDTLQNNFVATENRVLSIIESLRKDIGGKENEFNNLVRSQPKLDSSIQKTDGHFPFDISRGGDKNLLKIFQDIQEIKSFITVTI